MTDQLTCDEIREALNNCITPRVCWRALRELLALKEALEDNDLPSEVAWRDRSYQNPDEKASFAEGEIEEYRAVVLNRVAERMEKDHD